MVARSGGGARRRHEVAEPLAAAIDGGDCRLRDLLALIDAREAEAEPAIETLDDWRDYLLGSAGGLAVAAARLLGVADDPEFVRALGAAYGAAGVLRRAALARQGRCLLPADMLAEHGLSPEAVIGGQMCRPWCGSLALLPSAGCPVRHGFLASRLRQRCRLCWPDAISAACPTLGSSAASAIGWR